MNTEQEMREAEVPRFKTLEELNDYINDLYEIHAKQHNDKGGESGFWGQDIGRAKSLAQDLYRIWLRGGDKAEAVFRIMRFQRGQ